MLKWSVVGGVHCLPTTIYLDPALFAHHSQSTTTADCEIGCDRSFVDKLMTIFHNCCGLFWLVDKKTGGPCDNDVACIKTCHISKLWKFLCPKIADNFDKAFGCG